MAQSVSNDALWLKLSEMDKKLDNISAEQKTSVSTQELAENKPDFTAVKEETITEIKEQSGSLNRHYDDIFKAANQDVKIVNGNILKVFDVVRWIRKQQRETVESQEEDKGAYFNFRFFKVRKSSFVIAILGLLVLILTLFCMKQQNDYSLLMDEYYRQSIVIKNFEAKIDSLRLH